MLYIFSYLNINIIEYNAEISLNDKKDFHNIFQFFTLILKNIIS
jgi:hypothetical protein